MSSINLEQLRKKMIVDLCINTHELLLVFNQSYKKYEAYILQKKDKPDEYPPFVVEVFFDKELVAIFQKESKGDFKKYLFNIKKRIENKFFLPAIAKPIQVAYKNCWMVFEKNFENKTFKLYEKTYKRQFQKDWDAQLVTFIHSNNPLERKSAILYYHKYFHNLKTVKQKLEKLKFDLPERTKYDYQTPFYKAFYEFINLIEKNSQPFKKNSDAAFINILNRRIIDFFKGSITLKAKGELSIPKIEDVSDLYGDIENQISIYSNESQASIKAEVAELKGSCKELIDLYYYNGWKMQEMADTRKVSKDTISKHIQKCLEKIKKDLGF